MINNFMHYCLIQVMNFPDLFILTILKSLSWNSERLGPPFHSFIYFNVAIKTDIPNIEGYIVANSTVNKLKLKLNADDFS